MDGGTEDVADVGFGAVGDGRKGGEADLDVWVRGVQEVGVLGLRGVGGVVYAGFVRDLTWDALCFGELTRWCWER